MTAPGLRDPPDDAEASRTLDRAIDELRIAVSQAPGDARTWERLGDAAGSAERLPEALHAFQRACALEPRNLAVAMKAALAASCLGRLRDARDTLESIAQRTPVNDAYFALGNSTDKRPFC